MVISRYILLGLVLMSALYGCATQPARNDPTQALSSGDYLTAFKQAEISIVYSGTEAERYIQAFKERRPESLTAITTYYRKKIETSSDTRELLELPKHMAEVHRVGLLSDSDHSALLAQLEESVSQRVRNGTLTITLIDDYKTLPALQRPDLELLIFKASVENLISTQSRPLARVIFAETLKKGGGSPQHTYLSSRLQEIRIPPDILTGDFEQLFPDEAQSRIQNSIVRFKLAAASDAETEYLYDLRSYLEAEENVHVEDGVQPGTYVLKLQRIRFQEREIPERTQTVRYERHQVNLLSAALLMPNNATYVYDVSTGGYAISYRFLVILTQDQHEVLRQELEGTLEETFSYCGDARIRNVFGGVSTADFVANPDMQRRCSSNTHSVDPGKTYKKAIQKVAKDILALPPIANRMRYGTL